jgi:hypothetical protein
MSEGTQDKSSHRPSGGKPSLKERHDFPSVMLTCALDRQSIQGWVEKTVCQTQKAAYGD